MIIEDKFESARRMLSDNPIPNSSLIRDVMRMKDRSLGCDSKLSMLIKKAEESSSRITLFNEFLGSNVLSQAITVKTFPKFKKALISISAGKIIDERFESKQKLWFDYRGMLETAQTEEVQVSLDQFKNAMVKGYSFIEDKKTKEKFIFAIDFIEGWNTGYVAMYCNESSKKNASSIISEIIEDSVKNNFFKKAKITPGGKFIKPDGTSMDDIILDAEVKRRIKSGTIDMLDKIDIYKKNGIAIKRGILMEGAPGCQPAGQQVLMYTGEWKNVEDVIVGDVVISPQEDGTTKPSIVAELKQYDSSIYEVKVGEETCRVAAEHLIVATTDRKRKDEIKKLIRNEIGDYFTITAKDICSKPKSFNDHVYGVFSPAVDINNGKDGVIHSYHLGILIGDGCLINGVNITTVDGEIVEEINNLANQFGVDVINKKSDEITYSLSVGRHGNVANPIIEELRDLGLYGLGSHEKFIPRDYLNSNVEQRLELLAGLIDTDGYKHIYGDSSSYEYTTVSSVLANDVAYLCKSLGFGVSISEKKSSWKHNGESKTGIAYRLQISPQDFIIPTRIGRKQGLLRNSEWKNIRHKHMEIVDENKVETVYGFTLDSSSGCYVTNGWIVTHNTGKTLIAKALCNQIDSTFIWVTADDVEYPSDISFIYNMARELSPTIVLFEDIDYIGKKRANEGGSYDKITGELLNQMDGVESNEGIITLASSNYPKALDKALRNRPGRFDIRVRFEYPDKKLRTEMFNRFLSKTDFSDINVEEMVGKTNGYSGAYIKELVLAATMLAIDAKSILEDGKAKIMQKHLNEALNQIESSRKLDTIKEEE